MKWIILFLLIFSIPIVSAIDFTPSGDINMRGIRAMKNATNITAQNFYYTNGIELVSFSYSTYFDQSLNTTSNVTFNKVSSTRLLGLLDWSWLENVPAYVVNYSSQIALKLNITDQRYNDTSRIPTHTSNLTNNNGFINSSYGNATYYLATNPSGYISSYIDTWNTTAQMQVAVAGNITRLIADNTTQATLIAGLVTSNTTTNTRINDLNSSKLNITDQRYNETATISAVNQTLINYFSRVDCSGENVFLYGQDTTYNYCKLFNATAASVAVLNTSVQFISINSTGNMSISGIINQTSSGMVRTFSNGCYEVANSTGLYIIC